MGVNAGIAITANTDSQFDWAAADKTVFDIALLFNTEVNDDLNRFATIRAQDISAVCIQHSGY